MSKKCTSISEEHRRKVGEGVRRAWQRRYAEGFKPKTERGILSALAGILMCQPERVIDNVKLLDEIHREMCERLHECCQKYKLGLGGERIDRLVCEEIDRLRSQG